VDPAMEDGLKLAEFMTCRPAAGPEDRLSTSGADRPKRHWSSVMMACLLAPVWLSVCVPRTLSTSCDQAVFVDHATDASVSPDVVSLKIDRFG